MKARRIVAAYSAVPSSVLRQQPARSTIRAQRRRSTGMDAMDRRIAVALQPFKRQADELLETAGRIIRQAPEGIIRLPHNEYPAEHHA
ncbi:hypothetical protein P3T39_007591 [Kitasatospora sp. GP82]|nr:hypothetical protein [Kitasatospora sp. GP82]